MQTKSAFIHDVFRPGDPDAVIVLRLVAAANDLGILFRMMLALTTEEAPAGILRESPAARSFRAGLDNAARIYVSRMGLLHLPDVWDLMNSLDYRRVEDRLSRRIPDIHDLSDRLRRIVNTTPFQRIVANARNDFAGHPTEDGFERALTLIPRSTLMEIPISTDGLGDHYNVTDTLYGAVIVTEAHARYKRETPDASFTALYEDVLSAQVALRNLAGGLLAGMYLDTIDAR